MRITTQSEGRALLRVYRGCIHCLDSATLSAQLKAERFERCRRAIFQHVVDRRVGFFVIHETGPPRRKR
jgi:hypothetical protein